MFNSNRKRARGRKQILAYEAELEKYEKDTWDLQKLIVGPSVSVQDAQRGIEGQKSELVPKNKVSDVQPDNSTSSVLEVVQEKSTDNYQSTQIEKSQIAEDIPEQVEDTNLKVDLPKGAPPPNGVLPTAIAYLDLEVFNKPPKGTLQVNKRCRAQVYVDTSGLVYYVKLKDCSGSKMSEQELEEKLFELTFTPYEFNEKPIYFKTSILPFYL